MDLKFTTIVILFIKFSIALENVDQYCENYEIGTKIPHPEDCNLYFKCTRDNDATFAMAISCQNGVFFNPISLECDPDYESEMCKKPETQPSNPKTTKKSTTTKKPKTKTTKLITTTIEMSDEETTDELTETEEDSEETTITNNSDIKTTTIDSEIVICPEQDNKKVKFIRSNDDCSKYFMCYHGHPLPLRCWNGLHFSPRHMKCTPAEIAKCELNNVEYPNCPKYGKVLLPHPNECRMFLYCIDGIKTIQRCGSFDHWDIIDRKCKRQAQATCYSDHENNKKRF